MRNILETLKRLWESLLGLGGKRLIALGLTGLTVFVLVGISGYFLSRPQQETLYSGLESQDVTRIGAALEDAGIPFDISVGGDAVLVGFGQAAQARMLLAQKGLPRSDNAGYELFDKLGSLGLTTFMQQVTKVRALEGELAKTIRLIDGVKAARVHLALRSEGSFRGGNDKASASVIIRTDGEAGAQAASSIRHLVAAAIPGLTPDQVTVMNADGTLLLSTDDPVSAAPEKLIGLERTVSSDVESKIGRTLLPYVGIENFRVSVSTKLNTDRRQINETTFDPNSRVERSTRTIKESGEAQNATSAEGITVEQNIPVEQAANPSGDTSSEKKDRKEELTNYEINSRSTSTVSDGYSIDRLSVAIVINRAVLARSIGENASEEQIAAKVQELQKLASSAAGLIESRGDTITISTVDFLDGLGDESAEPSGGILSWFGDHAPALLNTGVLLLITLLVLFLGLRPALKMIMRDPMSPDMQLSAPIAGLAPDAAGMPVADMSVSTAALDNFALPQLGEMAPDPLYDSLAREVSNSPKDRLAKIVELDPDRAVEVLKQWLEEPLERTA